MKDTYTDLRKEVLDVNGSVSSLLSRIINRPEIADARFDDWQKACRDLYKQITEDTIRVAVIGSIKSGKSTFVNSFFRSDYLKRGAGVVTSIITRIKSGKDLKAVLFFKSWDEVNDEIEQALIMFPNLRRKDENKPFDIRNSEDRHSLERALDDLSDDLLITDGTRNANTVLLSLYLKGYEHVRDMMSADSPTTEFKGKKFAEHRTFVGDDTLAVYLKDVKIEIKDDKIDRSIEIADCQGSDSPNPLHLAMIQDYLLRTHYIIYVISSRTGLRQADIRFLSIIKKMGILGNIIFIVNIDFSEHESLEDVETVVNKVKEELSLIKPDPDVYSFSALFNLFSVSSVKLPKKDSLRLAQWMAEEDIVAFSNNESRRFESFLSRKLTGERLGLLLKNHLERMDVMLSGIEHWSRMQKEVLEKDVDGAISAMKKMEHHQARMKQVRALIKNTLNGAAIDIMKGLTSDIDRFFNVYKDGVKGQTMSFVQQYSVSVSKYREKVAVSGFSKTLYLIFQQFKQSLDTFMAETINPEIAHFSMEIEKRIQNSLESVARPYHAMASDDIAELKKITGSMNKNTEMQNTRTLMDMDTLKQITGLELPSSTAALQYSARIRTEAVVRLGLYSAIKLLKKVIKKTPEQEQEEHLRALADGINLIKRETEKSINFHFENYRENFKFQYVAKLIKAVAEYLNRVLTEKYQAYDADLTAMAKMMEKKGSDREMMIHFLDEAASDAGAVREAISRTRSEIEK